MKEHHKRSVVKSVSYRVVGSLTTSAIVYVLTGKILLAIGAGSVDGIVKLVVYYLHERVWNNVRWGKHDEEK